MSSRSAGVRPDIAKRRFWIGLAYVASSLAQVAVILTNGWEFWDWFATVCLVFLLSMWVVSDRLLRRSRYLDEITAELAPLFVDERQSAALWLTLRERASFREIAWLRGWLVSVDVLQVPPDDRPAAIQRVVESFTR